MYKISEISALTGLSVATLRYYEELGLIKPQRLENNYREFTEKDLDWIAFILRAKQAGMSLEVIKKYSDLREKGDSTIIQRISLIVEQERILLAQQEELDSHIKFLRQKKHHYYELLEQRNHE